MYNSLNAIDIEYSAVHRVIMFAGNVFTKRFTRWTQYLQGLVIK